MNKQEFLDSVRSRLAGLPEADINKALEFYDESISDRIDDGLTEEQAVAALGSPEDVAKQILMDTPLPKLAKASSKTGVRRGLRVWEIILLVLGFPLWFPLLCAFFAVSLALVVVILAVIIVFFAMVLSFAVTGIFGLISAVFSLITGNGGSAVIKIGLALIALGLAFLLFIPAKALVLLLIEMMGRFVRWVKGIFVHRKNKEITK